MFEISFPELIILAVVALLVLGPERLPRAAQFAGLWVRRARAHWHSVKTEFERELADDELRRSLDATRTALQQAEAGVRDTLTQVDAAARGLPHDTPDAAAQADVVPLADASTEAASPTPPAHRERDDA